MPEADIALRVANATKRYGSVVALDSCDLEVRTGEFFALLGPSGSGKTTLLKLIGGFEQPSAGEIIVDGKPMAGVPPFRRNVNTVFQHYALFPHLTVLENVAYGLRMRGVRRRERLERAAGALERVELGGLGDRAVHALSGGQQQRVALARALINEPALLLLDEPLGALDAQLRRTMQIELKAMQRSVGITFIYVTHDQQEALSMADRIAVMREGRILQVGSPSEIYDAPASRFVAGFIGDASFFEGVVRAPGSAGVDVQLEDGTMITGNSTSGVVGGSAVTVAIRPECIDLQLRTSSTPPAGNALAAVVETRVFVGGDTHYVLRSPGGGSFGARLRNTAVRGAPPICEGDAVWACFHPADAVVLAAEGARAPVSASVGAVHAN